MYALLLASLQRGERGVETLVLALAVEHERCAVLCLERSDAYHSLLLVGELERAVGGCYSRDGEVAVAAAVPSEVEVEEIVAVAIEHEAVCTAALYRLAGVDDRAVAVNLLAHHAVPRSGIVVAGGEQTRCRAIAEVLRKSLRH